MAIVTSIEDPNDPLIIESCTYCRHPKHTLKSTEYMQATFEELEDAVKAACKTCTFRYNVALLFRPTPETQITFFQLHHFTFDHQTFYEIFKAPGVLDDELSPIPTRNFLAGQTSSEQTFWAIESWMQECLVEHDDCQSKSTYFPKRVLDITHDRIVIREGLEEAAYACLSHCWGPTQSPIKTLTTTLAHFTQDIPWSMLSKTFQDTVDICRRLHIDYLWIDSLCIIQDSEKDWSEQSLVMADIYENAQLTIAATKSRDGFGGCYSMADTESVECHPIIEGSIYIRKRIPEFETFYRGDHWPLLTRAWVYQEMRLSPRVLHFGSQEVIWQCRTCRRSESGCNDLNVPTTLTDMRGKDNLGSPTILNWYSTIYEYSHLSITFEKDRLAALAAVAQREAKKRGPDDVFLLGLWKNTLSQDLLWRIVPHQQPKRLSTWKAPTWSWVSIMSRVMWWGQEDPSRNDLQLLDCTQIYETDIHYIASPFLGNHTKAEIHIRGPLIQMTLEALNHNVPKEQWHKLILGDLWYNPQLLADYDYESSSSHEMTPEVDVYVLPIAIQASIVLDVVGLALISTKTVSDYTYERIGFVTMTVVEQDTTPLPRPIPKSKFKDMQTRIMSNFRTLLASKIVLM